MVSGKKLNVSVAPADPDAGFYLLPGQLAEQMKSEPGLVLVDVRSQGEYEALHIEQAKLATRELVEEIFTKWPKETPIVVYDHTGRQGLEAAKALASRGFTRARALRGGIDAWSQDVDPLIPRY